MTTTTDYDKQATDFLEDHHLRLTATAAGMACPPWEPCDGTHRKHGRRYWIEINRTSFLGQPTLHFDFWGSINDKNGNKPPTPYDVLACIASDSYYHETFEEWCGEFGCDTDSRAEFARWERSSAFTKKICDFFTEGELNDLREIQ